MKLLLNYELFRSIIILWCSNCKICHNVAVPFVQNPSHKYTIWSHTKVDIPTVHLHILMCFLFSFISGASKIELKKVNKKRTVTIRRIIIFLNISRHLLLIWLYCCLHQYKTLKAVATATIVVLTPAKNLNKVFWGFLVVSPLFNNLLGYV